MILIYSHVSWNHETNWTSVSWSLQILFLKHFHRAKDALKALATLNRMSLLNAGLSRLQIERAELELTSGNPERCSQILLQELRLLIPRIFLINFFQNLATILLACSIIESIIFFLHFHVFPCGSLPPFFSDFHLLLLKHILCEANSQELHQVGGTDHHIFIGTYG